VFKEAVARRASADLALDERCHGQHRHTAGRGP
jgi:hypothetical protein